MVPIRGMRQCRIVLGQKQKLSVKREIIEIVKVCHQNPIFNNFGNSCDLVLSKCCFIFLCTIMFFLSLVLSRE